jgi:hypothetical protein
MPQLLEGNEVAPAWDWIVVVVIAQTRLILLASVNDGGVGR